MPKKHIQTHQVNRVIVLLAFLILSSAVSACRGTGPQPTAEPTLSYRDHEIDPTFRKFYLHYGGVKVFGRAISDARFEGDVFVQYTEAAKMIYDPQASVTERFTLAPLGSSLIVPEPEVPQPQDPSLLYVQGHIIHPKFAETYKELAAILGKPLTEAHLNDEYHYIEQLFENMGLAYDPATKKVRFLAYGIAMCDSRCRTTAPETAIVFRFYPIDPTFSAIVANLGIDFTGYPITPGYYTEAGRWQQIFENIVLSTQAPNQPNTLIIEPIGVIIPFVKDPPAADQGDPAMHFVAVQGELGYAVPLYFWEYYLAHNGEAVIGLPVSQLHQVKGNTYVQCFTNLCLQYDLEAVESRRVRPYSLGYPYKTMYGPPELDFDEPPAPPTPTPLHTTITLKVWDALRTLDTRLQQEIGVYVALNGAPMSGVQPLLILTLPDGSRVEHLMPLTNVDGRAILRLPLIEGGNGDVVIYQICIQSLSSEQFCIEDSFVIWSNP